MKNLFQRLTDLRYAYLRFSPAELEKKARLSLVLLAITVAAYASVDMFYNVLGMKLLRTDIVGAVRKKAPPSAVSMKRSADYYAIIPQRNLFGTTDKSAFTKVQEQAAQVDMPDLSTILEVKGTVAGTGKDGFAVIEEKGKNKQLLYRVGNVVAGARLVRIMRNAVAFEVNKKEVILKMVESYGAQMVAPRQASQPEIAVDNKGTRVLKIDDVNAALKDMGTMLSQAQIRPYYNNGSPDGFIISNIKRGSIYEKVGLINGDIIQGTDYGKLQTAEDLTTLYNNMKTGSSFMLMIKRGGRDEALQYVFR